MVESPYIYHVFTADEKREIKGVEPYAKIIAELHNELFTDRVDISHLKQVLCRDFWAGLVLVESKASEIVGYGALRFPYGERTNEMELTEAYVKPEHRRRGIYRQILAMNLQVAKEFGAEAVFLLPMDLSIQEQLLEREGFERLIIEDLVAYRKRLIGI